MIRNRLISSAIAATMLVSLSGAVLAQDEAEAEDTGMPPGLPTMADFGAVDRHLDLDIGQPQ